MITIQLGNPAPRMKRREPVPRNIQTAEELVAYAANTRGMDATVIGQMIESNGLDATMDYIGERLVEYAIWDGPECTTTIHVSPETEAAMRAGHPQALMRETEKAWRLSARKPPTWIAGDDAQAVTLVAAVLGVSDVRELEG